ncbi:outer membrane lipoprotein carrier protein LolA [bacterium]|nr:outer membrane lipoprotein carrier protein LolA [bacterium]
MAKRILVGAFLLLMFLVNPPLGLAWELNPTIQKLQALYDKTDAWQAQFTQKTHVDLIDKTITKTGSILVKKPSHLKIDYHGDGARHYLSNGQTLWVYDSGVDQVFEYQKISKILASEALTFLKGLARLTDDFLIQKGSAADAMMDNAGLLFLELIPKKKDAQVEKIVLGLNAGNYRIEEMTLFNQSQNRTHYGFSSIVLNPVVPADVFELSADLKAKLVKGE